MIEKALTTKQPHVELLVTGSKRWETRSTPPHASTRAPVPKMPGLPLVAGERIALHASKTCATLLEANESWARFEIDAYVATRWPERETLTTPLDLAAIVALATFVRVIPIVGQGHEWSPTPLLIRDGSDKLTLHDTAGRLHTVDDVSEQLLLGGEFYDEGRWALEFDDIVRLDAPIPCRGNQGVWRLCHEEVGLVNAADEEQRSRPVRRR